MSLTAADVAEIMRLLEQSTFDELNLEMNGLKLSLRRGAAAGGASATPSFGAAAGATSGAGATFGAAANASGAAAGSHASTSGSHTARGDTPSAARASVTTGTANGAAATAAGVVTPAASSDPNIHDVPSPLLGTFYRSPKPGAPPFVEIGSTVEENTIVAIIEVMKLMNTVRAGTRGTVAEIIPGDGTLVEYDQPLLRIRKAG